MTETRGRKPLKAPPASQVVVDDVAVAEAFGAVDTMREMKADYTVERDTLNQLISRIQMGRAIGGLANALTLRELKSIKESKAYKNLAGQTSTDRRGLPIADLGTWNGFCRALGFSPDKLDEDLKNLDAFGEEALEGLTAIGAGYRDLRQYRKLPEDRRQALIDVAKVGDKEGFVELAEEIISKHVKEKELLEKQLHEATETVEAKDRVLGNKNALIDKLEERAAKRFKPDAGSVAKTEAEQVLLDAISEATLGVQAPLQRLFLAVDAAMSTATSEATELKASQAVEFVCQSLVDIAKSFRINIDLDTRLNPPWMDEEVIAAMERRAQEKPHTNPRAM